MKIGKLILAAAMFGAGAMLMMSSPVQSQEVPRIAKEEVRKMLESPDWIVIDVRQDSDWNLSREKIKGAVREDPDEVISRMDNYPRDKTLVFYCA